MKWAFYRAGMDLAGGMRMPCERNPSESPVRENRTPGSMSAHGKPGMAPGIEAPAERPGGCIHLGSAATGARVRLYPVDPGNTVVTRLNLGAW